MPDPAELLDELYAIAVPSREAYFLALGAPEDARREISRRFAHATLDVARRHGLVALRAALTSRSLPRDRVSP